MREHEVFDDHLQVRIDAHLNAYDGVIDALITTHKAIADRTDLEIGADTRWSAMWELAGRCLAVSRVVLHDLRGGFASEADGSLRGCRSHAASFRAFDRGRGGGRAPPVAG